MKAKSFFAKVYETIKNHFLLRNLVLAFCAIFVGVYVVSLLLNLYTRHGQKYIVPDLVGMDIAQGRVKADSAGGLEVVIIDSIYLPKYLPGMIIDQSPKSGSGVKSGRKLFVTINAVQPKMEVMPYVTDFSLRQAKNMLESKGFEISKLVYRSDLATNYVLSQTVDGRVIRKGNQEKFNLSSPVVLTVGRNSDAQLPVTPKVIGLTLRQAKSLIWEVGLNVGEIKSDPGIDITNMDATKVYRQVPNQSSRADFGSRVTLYLTLDEEKVHQGDKKSLEKIENTDQISIEEISEDELMKELAIE